MELGWQAARGRLCEDKGSDIGVLNSYPGLWVEAGMRAGNADWLMDDACAAWVPESGGAGKWSSSSSTYRKKINGGLFKTKVMASPWMCRWEGLPDMAQTSQCSHKSLEQAWDDNKQKHQHSRENGLSFPTENM